MFLLLKIINLTQHVLIVSSLFLIKACIFSQKCLSEVSGVCMFLHISSSWLPRGQRIIVSVGVFNLSHRLLRKVNHHTVALSPVQVTVGLLWTTLRSWKLFAALSPNIAMNFSCLLHSNLPSCPVFWPDHRVYNVNIGHLGSIDSLHYLDLWNFGMSYYKSRNYLHLQECYLKKSLSRVLGICQVHSVANKFSKILMSHESMNLITGWEHCQPFLEVVAWLHSFARNNLPVAHIWMTVICQLSFQLKVIHHENSALLAPRQTTIHVLSLA